MLACARIGAIHSVVFGGFAAHELATRIDDAKPRVILSASCGIEVSRVVPYKPLLDAAIVEARSKPEHCVILQRPVCQAELTSGRDRDWHELIAAARPADCVPVLATDPLYILYTSGTTGIPKGVVRDNGGHAVALHWSHAFDLWSAAGRGVLDRLGCRLGGRPLIHRLCPAAARLHDGHVRGQAGRDPRCRGVLAGDRAAWRPGLFHRPDRVPRDQARGSRGAADPHPRSAAIPRAVSGRRARRSADRRLGRGHICGVPVIDHWWQTETGWPIGANCLGIERLPVKHGSCDACRAGLGCARARRRGGGRRARARRRAKSARSRSSCRCRRARCRPCGRPTTVSSRSYLTAFPGFYQTGDAGFIDNDGYIHVMTRTDDIINVAAHRLSTGEIEEVLAAHPDVAECAVIGVADPLKGQVPLGFLVLKAGVTAPAEEIEREAVELVRERIGPVAELQGRARRRRPAKDPIGQDPARHDAPHRRRRGLCAAGDDRGPCRPRRNRRGARESRVRAETHAVGAKLGPISLPTVPLPRRRAHPPRRAASRGPG